MCAIVGDGIGVVVGVGADVCVGVGEGDGGVGGYGLGYGASVFSRNNIYAKLRGWQVLRMGGGRDVAHGRMFSPCSKGVATGRHPKPCLTTPTCMVTASAIVALYHGAGGVGWGGVCVCGGEGGARFLR